MTKTNDRLASISNFPSVLLAALAYAVSRVSGESIAAQNRQHKQCESFLTKQTFNETYDAETCTFTYNGRQMVPVGKCTWCPPEITPPTPQRTPKPHKPPTIGATPNPTPKPTQPIPTPDPTVKKTHRPTPRPHPTRPPTHRPTCMPALGLSTPDLTSKLLAASAQTQGFLNTGLMRVVLDGLVKYCVISAVSNNIYQLPASCMFSSITDANGTVDRYIPADWYGSLELKSGYGDFVSGVNYPGASQAFYPLDYLGPNSAAYDFAFVTVDGPISPSNEYLTVYQPARDAMLQQVEDLTESQPTPQPAVKHTGLRV